MAPTTSEPSADELAQAAEAEAAAAQARADAARARAEELRKSCSPEFRRAAGDCRRPAAVAPVGGPAAGSAGDRRPADRNRVDVVATLPGRRASSTGGPSTPRQHDRAWSTSCPSTTTPPRTASLGCWTARPESSTTISPTPQTIPSKPCKTRRSSRKATVNDAAVESMTGDSAVVLLSATSRREDPERRDQQPAGLAGGTGNCSGRTVRSKCPESISPDVQKPSTPTAMAPVRDSLRHRRPDFAALWQWSVDHPARFWRGLGTFRCSGRDRTRPGPPRQRCRSARRRDHAGCHVVPRRPTQLRRPGTAALFPRTGWRSSDRRDGTAPRSAGGNCRADRGAGRRPPPPRRRPRRPGGGPTCPTFPRPSSLLATAAVGAVWSSCGQDYAPEGAARMGQPSPRAVQLRRLPPQQPMDRQALRHNRTGPVVCPAPRT